MKLLFFWCLFSLSNDNKYLIDFLSYFRIFILAILLLILIRFYYLSAYKFKDCLSILMYVSSGYGVLLFDLLEVIL